VIVICREVLDAQVAAAEPQGGSGRNAMERIQRKVGEERDLKALRALPGP
jgi:hypothetical protein